MQTMDIIISVSEILLFTALTILAVYFIISLNKMTASVSRIENDITKTMVQIAPVITNLSQTINEVNAISEIARKEIHKIESLNASFTKTGHEILDNVENINRQLGKYVNNGVSFFSAISTGVKTFSKKMKEKNYESYKQI